MSYNKERFARTIKGIVRTGGEILRDARDQVISEHDTIVYNEGRCYQKNKDIRCVVQVLLELKQNDAMIFDLLNRHFCVSDISEAQEYIKTGKCIFQLDRLRDYCIAEGMSLSDFRIFVMEHNIKQKLRVTPKLLDLPANKLKAILEKEC